MPTTVLSMTFKEWMLRRGLSPSTAEKYAGAISGSLTEWGLAAGILQGPLDAMESPRACAEAASKLAKLPVFAERNMRGHNMYSSALSKFSSYIEEVSSSDALGSDIEDVLNDQKIGLTEKVELIKARIGQGVFRQKLLLYWTRCAVTGYQDPGMLVASHIKPWSKSSNAERLDPFNGLILVPNLDRAFDRGLISFENNGRLLISPLLGDAETLGIVAGSRIALQTRHHPFMEYHRKHVYRGA
ncbi:HNH endonuclease [Achromobacter veterisilvae]|uniref:HNH endonuclease n=1 Tax=Achromobacter veterisilvae TaxID=2069367 RepID=A0ABZ2S2H6_9BURK